MDTDDLTKVLTTAVTSILERSNEAPSRVHATFAWVEVEDCESELVPVIDIQWHQRQAPEDAGGLR